MVYGLGRPDTGITTLPSSVYTDIANTALAQVTVPRGRYTVPSDFSIQRSNLVLDFRGSSLLHTPDTSSLFYVNTPTDNTFTDPASPTRHLTHLTGTITPSTTQLTMDPAEIVGVTPGEVVQIAAGVNTSDPV